MLICVLEDTVTEMGIILSMKLLCNTTEKNVVGNKKTNKQTNKQKNREILQIILRVSYKIEK